MADLRAQMLVRYAFYAKFSVLGGAASCPSSPVSRSRIENQQMLSVRFPRRCDLGLPPPSPLPPPQYTCMLHAHARTHARTTTSAAAGSEHLHPHPASFGTPSLGLWLGITFVLETTAVKLHSQSTIHAPHPTLPSVRLYIFVSCICSPCGRCVILCVDCLSILKHVWRLFEYFKHVWFV